MYHVELRQFPHNFCRFNITERELRETILDAWSRGEWVELGERKWSPHQASLTVLEGPRLPVEQLSMGRGWSNAGRQGRDVTAELLASARAASGAQDGVCTGVAAASSVASAEPQTPTDGETAHDTAPILDSAVELRLAADSIGLELLAELSEAPMRLAIVWQLARQRYPEHSASDCLRLAEYAVRSLVESRLAVVLAPRESGEREPCSQGEQLECVLRAIDSWSTVEDAASALIGRV